MADEKMLEEQTEKQTEKQTAEPTLKSSTEPAAESTAEPASEPTAEVQEPAARGAEACGGDDNIPEHIEETSTPFPSDEDIKEKKQNSLEADEFHQYNNCILIQGNDLRNFLINTGHINGSINQQSGVQTDQAADSKVRFEELGQLQEFILHYENTVFAAALITLAVLKTVPRLYLIELAECLQQHMGIEDKSQIYVSIFKIEDIIGAEERVFEVNTEAGIIETEFLVLKDPEAMSGSFGAIWITYPGIRSSIVNWLRSIGKNKRFRKFVLYQTRDAFADIAAIDFLYIKADILPIFQVRGSDHLYYLTGIFEKALQVEAYKDNVDTLLSHWCTLDNTHLLQALLIICDLHHGYRYPDNLKKKLTKMISDEIKSAKVRQPKPGQPGDIICIYKKRGIIPFRILQQNPDAAELYTEILGKLFDECRTRADQIRFGYYFANLLVQDYYAEDGRYTYSMFLGCLKKKEVRVQLRPLLQYMADRRMFWRMVKSLLLNGYLRELSADGREASWEYIKPFIRELSFTGNREHYIQMMDMLEQISDNDPKAGIAAWLKTYLEELLRKQMNKKEKLTDDRKNI